MVNIVRKIVKDAFTAMEKRKVVQEHIKNKSADEIHQTFARDAQGQRDTELSAKTTATQDKLIAAQESYIAFLEKTNAVYKNEAVDAFEHLDSVVQGIIDLGKAKRS